LWRTFNQRKPSLEQRRVNQPDLPSLSYQPKQINNYLNTLEKVKKSYLWKDIPEYVLFEYGFITSYDDNRLLRKSKEINPIEDVGSDIIYIDKEDKCIIVQCKYYSKTIRIKDIAGFSFILLSNDVIGMLISAT
jgi:predicted helicase